MTIRQHTTMKKKPLVILHLYQAIEYGDCIDNGKIAIKYDNSDMVNYSNNPIIAENQNYSHSYTSQDVYEGEELTEDYRIYEFIPLRNSIHDKYGVKTV